MDSKTDLKFIQIPPVVPKKAIIQPANLCDYGCWLERCTMRVRAHTFVHACDCNCHCISRNANDVLVDLHGHHPSAKMASAMLCREKGFIQFLSAGI